jgi:hypothetical protein
LHNQPKWKVTRITNGIEGGYAFSVSVDGGPPLGGYFLKTLTGYVRFPKKLMISLIQRKRLQKPLRKQVAHIVTTHDPRYHSGDHPIKPNDQPPDPTLMTFDTGDQYDAAWSRWKKWKKAHPERFELNEYGDLVLKGE